MTIEEKAIELFRELRDRLPRDTYTRAEVDALLQGEANQRRDLRALVEANAHSHPAPAPEPEPEPEPSPAPTPTHSLDEFTSFQHALNSAPVGSTVLVPARRYDVAGTLLMQRQLNLVFEAGAVIYWGASKSDGLRVENIGDFAIHGMRSHHLSDTRTGRNLRLVGCMNVEIGKLYVERSGSVGVTLDSCEHVTIDGYVNTDEDFKPGNVDDGMDVRNCRFVTLRNFDIYTQDDGWSAKTMGGLAGETHHLTLERGRFRGKDAAISIGAEIDEDIHDLVIRDVRFEDCGIPFFFKNYSPDYQGKVYNVLIDRATLVGTSDRYVDFLTAKGRENKCHDIEFRNVDISQAKLSDRVGYGQAILHADRQGPNLVGLDAFV